MLTANDLRQKFRIVPGQQSVTFTPMNPPAASLIVEGARIQDITAGADVQSLRVTSSFESKLWILPAANMQNAFPELGDQIDDGQTKWRVVDMAPAVMAGTVPVEFKCVCNRERQ